MIDHERGGPIEVLQQLGLLFGVCAGTAHGGLHVLPPRVSLRLTYDERGVTHPQSGVAPLLGISRGTTPVLNKKGGQPGSRLGQVVRIQRSQHRILLNERIEVFYQRDEKLVTAYAIVQCSGH